VPAKFTGSRTQPAPAHSAAGVSAIGAKSVRAVAAFVTARHSGKTSPPAGGAGISCARAEPTATTAANAVRIAKHVLIGSPCSITKINLPPRPIGCQWQPAIRRALDNRARAC